MNNIPPLPDGFTLDEEDPPLPEGFTLDAPQEKPEGSIIDYITEPLKTIAGGMLGSAVGHVASMAEVTPAMYAYRALTGQEAPSMESADKIMSDIQEFFRNDPDTQKGEQALEYLDKLMNYADRVVVKPITAGGAGVLAGMGNAINPTTPFHPIETAFEMNRRVKDSSVSNVLKEDIYATTGSPMAAKIAETLPMVGETLLGAKMAGVKRPEPPRISKRQAKNDEIMSNIQNNSADIETAKFELDDPKTKGSGYTLDENGEPILVDNIRLDSPQGVFSEFTRQIRGDKPKLKKDPLAIEAIRQGFDEGAIASIKSASPIDQAKMLRMIQITRAGKSNTDYRAYNRASDVVGDSLASRVKVILNTNRKAGAKLDSVAGKLKGETADFDTPVNAFLNELDNMGISINKKGQPNFNGSDIEGATDAEAVVRNIVNRMRNTRVPDAYDMHRLKKYIDGQVTWGKGKSGLIGKTEIILKNLRNGIDSKLDGTFPEYDKVNTDYASTIAALDDLQRVTGGSKINFDSALASKRLGTELRSITSNNKNRTALMEATQNVEQIANRYADTPFNDSLLKQIVFNNELDRKFGASADTSFQAEVKKAITQGLEAQKGPAAMAFDAGIEVAKQSRGINENGAFKAMENLLKKKKVESKPLE